MKVNTDGILLGAWSKLENDLRVLDIGTGTGLIALMMAQRDKSIKIDAIEIDENAYIDACENVKNSPFAQQIEVIKNSIQMYAPSCIHKYNLIVSNPPFYSGGTLSLNENKARVKHTLKLSHVDLLNSVKKLLTQDGVFDVILPYIEGMRFIEIARHYNLYPLEILNVLSRNDRPIERCMIRFGLSEMEKPMKSSLIMRHGHDPKDLTQDYISLVKDFYTFL